MELYPITCFEWLKKTSTAVYNQKSNDDWTPNKQVMWRGNTEQCHVRNKQLPYEMLLVSCYWSFINPSLSLIDSLDRFSSVICQSSRNRKWTSSQEALGYPEKSRSSFNHQKKRSDWLFVFDFLLVGWLLVRKSVLIPFPLQFLLCFIISIFHWSFFSGLPEFGVVQGDFICLGKFVNLGFGWGN